MTEQRMFAPDPWTEFIPRPIHWVLTIATLGLWALFWRNSWKIWLPATVSGAMVTFSFAEWNIWPLCWVFLVPLYFVLSRCDTKKQAFLWSWWAGWVLNFGGFWWITGLLIDFGHMHWSLALGICLILNLYQGLSLAVMGLLTFVLKRRSPALPMVLVAPVLWSGIELLIPLLFPYYLGNSQFTFPAMIQTAELWGPIGVSAVLMAFNGGVIDLVDAFVLRRGESTPKTARKAQISFALGAVLIAVNIVYGFVRIGQVEADMEAAEKLKIGMVEADIGIWEKEDPKKLSNNLITHHNLSKKLAEEDKVDLIVWPESSFQSRYVFASTEKTNDPEVAAKSVKQYRRWFPQDVTWIRPSQAPLVQDASEDKAKNTPLNDIYTAQRGFNTPLLIGGISFRDVSPEEMKTNPPNKKVRRMKNGKVERVPRPYRLYNTAALLDEKGFVRGIYNKTFLLAFGEYIPGASLWPWVYDVIPEASEFTPGAEVKVFDLNGHRLGMMICYEDIIASFGRDLAKLNPHVIINMTNDAWFGKTSEPYLHLSLATFRAVESRKWLLRSTNTGVTAFIDANGRIVSETSIYEPETLSAEVPMMTGGPTPYVMTGDVIGYAGLLGILGLFWASRRRKEEEIEA